MNKRRELLKLAGAAATLSLAGCATMGGKPKARVVVVGGGFGGATAAKYIRLWDPGIEVTLIERNPDFISCPTSNLVLGGSKTLDDIRRGYDGLARHGVRVVRGDVVALDAAGRKVRLANGTELPFDRIVVSPGIDFMYNELPRYETAAIRNRVLHAWKAGDQTVLLRARLEAMRDGGVYVLSIPLAPYRCPPGPYERVCQVASYFKKAKPRSKILVVDANPDVTS